MDMEFYLKRRVKIHEGHWLWARARTGEGYGSFRFKGEMVKAHRMSYLTFVGPIPEDKPFVLHKRGVCHIRHCINPDHLYVGTAQDNMDDLMADGRHSNGTSNTQYSDEIIKTVRQRCAMGELQQDVARDFGMSQQHVSRIVNHKRRK
jgi:hypothetical protein